MTAFFRYVEILLLRFMKMDWARSRVQEWPRYLESLSLFWIEACVAAVWTQLLAMCVHGCIRQFRRKSIPRKPLQAAAYAAREDSAAGYASVFYPIVIAAEWVSGFLIWMLWDLLHSRKQMRA